MSTDQNPFTITTSSDVVEVQAGSSAQVELSVTNISGREIVGRPSVVAENGEVPRWFTPTEGAEHPFGVGETKTIRMAISPPRRASAGDYACGVVVSNIENPDEWYTEGPSLTVKVGEADKKGFPWWILAVVGGVLLLIGVGVGVFFLTQGGGGAKLAGVQLESAGSVPGEAFVSAVATDDGGEPLEEAESFDNAEKWAWTAAQEDLATVEATADGALVHCSDAGTGDVQVTLTSLGLEPAITGTATVTCEARLTSVRLSLVGGGKVQAGATGLIEAAQLDQAERPLESVSPFDDAERWAWSVAPEKIAEVQATAAGATLACKEDEKGPVTVEVVSVGLDTPVQASLQVTCEPAPRKAPAPTGEFTVLPPSGRVPLTVQFVSQDPGAKRWSWDFGDGNQAEGMAPQHTYTEPGRYTVTLSVVNPDRQRAKKAKEGFVKVQAAPKPDASFTALPVRGNTPLRVQFAAKAKGARSYRWDFGDGNSSTSARPTHTYTKAGRFTVELTVTNPDGQSATSTQSSMVYAVAPQPRPRPAPAPSGGASVAYVWGNNATAANYTPSSSYAKGAGNIRRTAVGRYTWAVPGGEVSGKGNVQVSAYGNNANHCQVVSWGGSVNVACFNQAGAPVDSQFTALALNGGSASNVAYVWANNPTAASYTPSGAYAYSPGATPRITRSGTGTYRVQLANSMVTSGATIMVTAYGSTPAHCRIVSWGGGAANVKCLNMAGQPVDSRYSLLVVRGSTNPAWDFVWANNATSASYAPSGSYLYTAGGTPRIRRSAVGRYTVDLPAGTSGNVQVTAYGNEGVTCHPVNWGPRNLNVACFDAAGRAKDSRFTLLSVRR